ncbi:FAD-dependent oxidoreductase [Streptomyces sp. NPDC003758]
MLQRDRHDVVVVGAGIAGLAATSALVAAGRDTVCLEARDRCGGRVTRHRGRGPGPVRSRTARWAAKGPDMRRCHHLQRPAALRRRALFGPPLPEGRPGRQAALGLDRDGRPVRRTHRRRSRRRRASGDGIPRSAAKGSELLGERPLLLAPADWTP